MDWNLLLLHLVEKLSREDLDGLEVFGIAFEFNQVAFDSDISEEEVFGPQLVEQVSLVLAEEGEGKVQEVFGGESPWPVSKLLDDGIQMLWRFEDDDYALEQDRFQSVLF
jgi:hypothetical protein